MSKEQQPVMFRLPREAHGEIRWLLRRTRLTPERIAEFGSLMMTALERRTQDAERSMWWRLAEILPDIKGWRAKLDVERWAVVEMDAEGVETGRSADIPEYAQHDVWILHQECAIPLTCQRRVGLVCMEMEREQEAATAELAAALVRWLPQTADGDWVLDDRRMMMVRSDQLDAVTTQEGLEEDRQADSDPDRRPAPQDPGACQDPADPPAPGTQPTQPSA